MTTAHKIKIGIFGGSFNPPHIAHTELVRLALTRPICLDHVFVVPTYKHPFRKRLVSFENRLEMLRLAFANLPASLQDKITISTLEQDDREISYTVETVRKLRDLYPEAKWHLLIGSDIIPEFHLWYQYKELLRLAPPIAFPRQGVPVVEMKGIRLVKDALLPNVNSTHLRELLASRTDEDVLTRNISENVLAFIRRKRLYRSLRKG